MKKYLCIILLIFFSTLSLAQAEMIRLKDGKEFNGSVVEKTQRAVKIETDKGLVVLPLDILDENSRERVDQAQINDSKEERNVAGSGSLSAALDPGPDPSVGDDAWGLIYKTLNAYRSLETYQSEGTSELKITHSGGDFKDVSTTSEFTIMLKKPNFYKIRRVENHQGSENRRETVSWGNGGQFYFYSPGKNNYFQTRNMSGGTAAILSGLSISALFFSEGDQEFALRSIVDPTVIGLEEVDGEECFVVRAENPTPNGNVMQKYWIRKKDYLIAKSTQVSTVNKNARREMTDEQIEEGIRRNPMLVTKKDKQMAREQAKMFRKVMRSINDSSSVVSITGISTPEFNDEDFVYELPGGVLPEKKEFYNSDVHEWKLKN